MQTNGLTKIAIAGHLPGNHHARQEQFYTSKYSALSRLLCVSPPTWTGSEKSLLSRARVWLLPRHVSMTKKSLALSGQGSDFLGFNWALRGAFKWPLRQEEQMKPRGGQKAP